MKTTVHILEIRKGMLKVIVRDDWCLNNNSVTWEKEQIWESLQNKTASWN